jgi:plasmid stabilization system protein ParE
MRRLLLKNFPYAIFYRINGDAVVVVSVAHHKRKPRDWDA